MKATTTSRIYGLILANPGITSRTLKKHLPEVIPSVINSTLQRLCISNAIKGVAPAGKPRSTGYYKGAAPAVLRNAAQDTKHNANAKLVMDVKQAIAHMQTLLAKLEEA